MNLNFIKLDINILDDTKIKLIRKYPDGDKLIILWIGLLCAAMKSSMPGYIYITNDIPYTIKDLSVLFDIEEKTVQMGIELFKQYNMIEVLNGGIIEIVNFNRHQKLDKIEKAKEISRESSKKYREKQKQLLISDGHVTKSDETETETETELETDYIEPDNIDDTSNHIHKEIIDYLNQKTGKSYKYTTSNIRHINARLKEGYAIEHFKTVIDIKCNEWLKTDMNKYLRPETLFGNKFESYLQSKVNFAVFKDGDERINHTTGKTEYFYKGVWK